MNLTAVSGPWEWLVALILWGAWIVALLGILIIFAGVVVGVYQGVHKQLAKRQVIKDLVFPPLEEYLREAEGLAKDMQRNRQLSSDPIKAFMAGATWGCGWHKRYRK